MELTPLRLVGRTSTALSDDPARRQRPRLGDVLRARGQVTETDIDAALQQSREGELRLGEALCANGVLQPKGLVEALEAQWGIRRIDLTATPPDARLVSQIGPITCLRDQCVPWRRVGAATVVVSEDPHRFETLRDIYESRLGPVMLALAGPGEVGRAVARSHRRALVSRAETRVAEPMSCRKWRGTPFQIGAGLVGVALGVGAVNALAHLTAALVLLATVALLPVAGLKLAATLAHPRPRRDSTGVYDLHISARSTRLPVISLLVPLYREEHIAGHLIHRLTQLDYPRALLDVCLVVEEHDTITHGTLQHTDLPDWMRVLEVPHGSVKTKPRAMNFALDFCRGSVIGIYDAEDAPAPDQLLVVARHFATAAPKVACLQGSLDFYNTRHNWMSRCFTLEYAGWFRVMLPGIARLGLVVPLGGTTLFFRRKVLEQLGAWDAHNVTEDADLGVRLARAGYRTEIIDTVTQEEANARPLSWVRQRSRWLKGYAMTYAVHMRDPAALWRDLGPWRFFGFQTMFLGTLIQFTLAPLLWSMWVIPMGIAHPVEAVLPGTLLIAICLVFCTAEAINLGLTARALQRTGRLALLPWGVTLSAYFALASLAMYKALAEMLHRPFYWDKTHHGRFGGTGTTLNLVPSAAPVHPVRGAPIAPVAQSHKVGLSASSRNRVSNALEM